MCHSPVPRQKKKKKRFLNPSPLPSLAGFLQLDEWEWYSFVNAFGKLTLRLFLLFCKLQTLRWRRYNFLAFSLFLLGKLVLPWHPSTLLLFHLNTANSLLWLADFCSFFEYQSARRDELILSPAVSLNHCSTDLKDVQDNRPSSIPKWHVFLCVLPFEFVICLAIVPSSGTFFPPSSFNCLILNVSLFRYLKAWKYASSWVW